MRASVRACRYGGLLLERVIRCIVREATKLVADQLPSADAAAGTGTLSADAASTWHHGATASTAVSGVPSPLQRQLQRRRQVVVVVPVCLWVLGDNAPAIAFYRRHGFEVVVTDRHARFGRRRDYKYFCMIRTLSVPLVGPGPAAM